MVMFKARFKPTEKPQAGQQQQQPQPEPTKVPPIEEERGPQAPVKLPGNPGAPERAGKTGATDKPR
jgi:hypothetical protein